MGKVHAGLAVKEWSSGGSVCIWQTTGGSRDGQGNLVARWAGLKEFAISWLLGASFTTTMPEVSVLPITFPPMQEVAMLTIWGAREKFCDGINRRNFLKIGALGAGLTLADVYRLRALGGT